MTVRQFSLLYFVTLAAALYWGISDIEEFSILLFDELGREFSPEVTYAKVLIWFVIGAGAFQVVALWALRLFGYVGKDDPVID